MIIIGVAVLFYIDDMANAPSLKATFEGTVIISMPICTVDGQTALTRDVRHGRRFEYIEDSMVYVPPH
jgi:hypothetical protein